VTKPAAEETHTGQGAPTDEAHLEAGNGSLTGSTPTDELLEQVNSRKTDDGGTG